MPPHCAADMAPVPESVSRSMGTSSALSRKRLQAADCRAAARCARVVNRMGSTVLMRNGSMMVLNGMGNRDEKEKPLPPRGDKGLIVRQRNQTAGREPRGSGQRDTVTLQRAALDAVQRGDGTVERDLGLQLTDAGGIKVRLRLEHAVGGGKAGIEPRLLELVLLQAQGRGERGDLHAFRVGLDRAHGAADLDLDALLDLAQADLLAIERGQALAIARPVGNLPPRIGEGKIN